MEFPLAQAVVASGSVCGIIADTQIADDESGEAIEEPVILARHGDVPAEFRGEGRLRVD